MNEFYTKKLEDVAAEKANEIEDVDIEVLKQLFIDGANWMFEEIKNS